MPHHKSASKRLLTNEKSRLRNMAVKSALRKEIKAVRAESGEAGATRLPEIYAALDRAARKGVIPKSRADRLKSRMARHLQRSTAS